MSQTERSDAEPDTASSTASRRGFLGVAAVAMGGTLLAPAMRLIEIAQAATPPAAAGTPSAGANPKVRWGLLIDTDKVRQRLHRLRHRLQHRERPGHADRGRPTRSGSARSRSRRSKAGRTASLPVMCQHCADPPCVDVCPTGASFKRADGIVLVDRHTCIGCRYCVMACPYKARSFVHETLTDQKPDVPRGKGCVESCTLCVHRIDRGRQNTACAEACSQGRPRRDRVRRPERPRQRDLAPRARGGLEHATAADLRLDPGVRYQGL